MPRLLLVFLSVVFLELEIGPSIMIFFVAVVTCDPEEIFFRAFRPYSIRGCNSRSTRAGVLVLAFLLLKPFFGLLLSFFGGLRIARRIIQRLGLLGLFRLFNPKVIHGSALSLYLSRGNMSRMIVLLGSVVYLLNVRSGLEACFGLGLNRLLDYLFPGVQLSTSLLYLSFYRGLRPFWKNLIRSDSSGVPSVSNSKKIEWRCFR